MRARVAEQADERAPEVVGVGQRPQRRPLAVHDHRLAAPDAVDDRVVGLADGDRHDGVVGVRRADDRDREAGRAVGGSSRSSHAILLREYSQYGFASGVDSVITGCTGGFWYADAELMNTN